MPVVYFYHLLVAAQHVQWLRYAFALIFPLFGSFLMRVKKNYAKMCDIGLWGGMEICIYHKQTRVCDIQYYL